MAALQFTLLCWFLFQSSLPTVDSAPELICHTCYSQVSSMRATTASTTQYRSVTIYSNRETCAFIFGWFCSYEQTSRTVLTSTAGTKTVYATVYSQVSEQCNCVTRPPVTTATPTDPPPTDPPPTDPPPPDPPATEATTEISVPPPTNSSSTDPTEGAVNSSFVATDATKTISSSVATDATKTISSSVATDATAATATTSEVSKDSPSLKGPSSTSSEAERPSSVTSSGSLESTSSVSSDLMATETPSASAAGVLAALTQEGVIGLGVGILLLLTLLLICLVLILVVTRCCLIRKKQKSAHIDEDSKAANIYAEVTGAMLTGYSNVDGQATIKDSYDAVVYHAATPGQTDGGGPEGVIQNPMYASVGDSLNTYGLYHYVPTKKHRSAAPSSKEQEALQEASVHQSAIYQSIYQTHVDAVAGSDESPYQQPPSKLEELYDDLASKKCLEIPPSHLNFGKELGSGEFGIVCKGEWLGPQGSSEVALKVTHKGVPEEEKVKLLQEAAIMKQFTHPNVVRLLGTVTTSEPFVLVVELLKNGCLISYLCDLPVKMDDSRCSQFLGFCRQIAEGMKYLSNKGFVHRDLAARNVLLDAQFVCKISDFGLSRNLDDNTYYVVSGGKIPLRWTAPEALFYRKFATSSDVWSYGMALYEIWTFGERPFDALPNEKIVQLLNAKFNEGSDEQLLACPKDCPPAVFAVMQECWNCDYRSRISFAGVLNGLGKIR